MTGKVKRTVVLFWVIAVVFALCACGSVSQKTPIDGYDKTTTYDEVAKRFKNSDINLKESTIEIDNYEWEGMKGKLKFEFFNKDKTLSRVRFSMDYQTRYGHTEKEITEAYEKAEKAFILVRDYYNLSVTKNSDYTSSKEHKATGRNDAGRIECYADWFQGRSTIAHFWIDFNC